MPYTFLCRNNGCIDRAELICEECGIFAYCSKKCQEEDWIARHHRKCKITGNTSIRPKGYIGEHDEISPLVSPSTNFSFENLEKQAKKIPKFWTIYDISSVTHISDAGIGNVYGIQRINGCDANFKQRDFPNDVVIKVFNTNADVSVFGKLLTKVVLEVHMLQYLKRETCENLLKYYGLWEIPPKLSSKDRVYAIAMEYVGEDLFFHQSLKYDSEAFLDVAIPIAKQLKCLHKNGIVHGDIKLENIGYTRKWGKYRVALIDYGGSCVKSKLLTNANLVDPPSSCKDSDLKGTKGYQSPEMFIYEWDDNFKHYDLKSHDVWALGITFVLLSLSVDDRIKYGFPKSDPGDNIKFVEKNWRWAQEDPKTLEGRIVNLVKLMLEKNPNLRVGMDQVAWALKGYKKKAQR